MRETITGDSQGSEEHRTTESERELRYRSDEFPMKQDCAFEKESSAMSGATDPSADIEAQLSKEIEDDCDGKYRSETSTAKFRSPTHEK